MSQRLKNELHPMEGMSALVDGELDAVAVERACDLWRVDANARARWHAFHLIGDVLRAQELASTAERDHEFLAALDRRLAQEAVTAISASGWGVPLTGDTDLAAHEPRRLRLTPVAIGVGIFGIVAVITVTQFSSSPSIRSVQSEFVGDGRFVPSNNSTMHPGSGNQDAELVTVARVRAGTALSAQVIRNVRLDEYLAAHKNFGGSSAPGAHSAILRKVTADSDAR